MNFPTAIFTLAMVDAFVMVTQFIEVIALSGTNVKGCFPSRVSWVRIPSPALIILGGLGTVEQGTHKPQVTGLSPVAAIAGQMPGAVSPPLETVKARRAFGPPSLCVSDTTLFSANLGDWAANAEIMASNPARMLE